MFVLDTNAISDYINAIEPARTHIYDTVQSEQRVYLCQPVYYEVLRGLLKVNATRKLEVFRKEFVPLLQWLPLINEDWQLAAELWAETSKQGKQFSDTDLLIAAATLRLDGILVSADDDFDALPIKRENWRES
jgi:tRNA(fMet)-specific endonuclease VapC